MHWALELIIAISTATIAGAFGIRIFMLEAHEKRLEKDRALKWTYITPLIRSGEELYNQINGLRRKTERRYLEALEVELNRLATKGFDELVGGDGGGGYRRLRVLYCCCSFFASVEPIKREAGLLILDSPR